MSWHIRIRSGQRCFSSPCDFLRILPVLMGQKDNQKRIHIPHYQPLLCPTHALLLANHHTQIQTPVCTSSEVGRSTPTLRHGAALICKRCSAWAAAIHTTTTAASSGSCTTTTTATALISMGVHWTVFYRMALLIAQEAAAVVATHL